jgi:hypothetical protein
MMKNEMVQMALFKEEEINEAAEAIARLRGLGLRDKDMSVISGVPYSERILGRPIAWTRVPLIALAGALVGFMGAVGLNVFPNIQYPLTVGGMPLFALPTSIVVTFELTMLGLLISTFIGVFIETISPSFGPRGYHPKVSDGYIGILYTSSPKMDERIHQSLDELGAEFVPPEEVIQK